MAMDPNGLRARIRRREMLCGTFVKTATHEIVEVLATSGLDFICLDAEHSSFDRGNMDASLAMARALGVPCLVRVPVAAPEQILMAMDGGAVGVVVPHCYTPEIMESAARAAHFGVGGRGFAGSTRWAGWQTKSIADVLALDEETVVIGQIEEPEGVENVEAIAALEQVDGLFAGPADLAVSYGKTDIADPMVRDAIGRMGRATAANGKAAVTFAPNASFIDPLKALGVSMFFFASEHAFMLSAAKSLVAEFRDKSA